MRQKLKIRSILLVVIHIMSMLNQAFALSATKTALITGSTDGIGVTTAKNLAAKGYNVIIHGRSTKRIDRAVGIVQSYKESGIDIHTVAADISTVVGCRKMVENVRSILNGRKLDVLINNAGVFEQNHQITEDGLELTFATNVMAPFVITSNLLPEMIKEQKRHSTDSSSSASRIIITSSISQCGSINDWDDLHFQQRRYSAHRAYSESKLLDAMLSVEFAHLLQRRHGTDTITCNSLDPGTVNTKMLLAGWGPCGIDVEDALDETWISSRVMN